MIKMLWTKLTYYIKDKDYLRNLSKEILININILIDLNYYFLFSTLQTYFYIQKKLGFRVSAFSIYPVGG